MICESDLVTFLMLGNTVRHLDESLIHNLRIVRHGCVWMTGEPLRTTCVAVSTH